MVDILRKNPAVVVDVCLGRLHQKVGEWEKDQARMGEIWQKMYDTNYHKSLDHRSFYFKQVTTTPVLGRGGGVAKVMAVDSDLGMINPSNTETRCFPFMFV